MAEDEAVAPKPVDAINNVRTSLDPVLDFLESLTGADEGTITINDVYGNHYEISDSLPLYHEVRGARALRKLWKTKHAPEVVAEIEEAWESSPFEGILTMIELAALNDELAGLLDEVFDGFHGDTPGLPGSGLFSQLRSQARKSIEARGGDPDQAPTSIRFLLGAGEIIRSMLPFCRSISKALREIAGRRQRAA